MKIKDKRIVVTGAASGIGLALCEEFHASGVKSIVCVDINEDGARSIAEKVNGIAIAADVSSEKDIINVIEKANEYSGGIDIFCSNAGVGGAPMFLETTSEEWNSTWSINVMSHVHAAKHVLPQMLERGEGLHLFQAFEVIHVLQHEHETLRLYSMCCSILQMLFLKTLEHHQLQHSNKIYQFLQNIHLLFQSH